MQDIYKKLPGIEKNIPLDKYTTFRIGGSAEYFFKARTKEDVAKAIKAANECNTPFFVLGGGSNLLIADEGYKGLVIKIDNQNLVFDNDTIKCGVGVSLGKLVTLSAERGLSGFEWAAGIPGTIGGAIFGNAGAFEYSIADVLVGAQAFDIQDQQIKTFLNKNCGFSYRSSVFKKNPSLIILSAEFQLKEKKRSGIEKEIKEHLEYRKKAHPISLPCAGSIFKNKENLTAGYLIEKCGLKGKKLGGVEVSEKHANFIVNTGSGTAKDVKLLISLIKKEVKEKTGITLEEEIQYLS